MLGRYNELTMSSLPKIECLAVIPKRENCSKYLKRCIHLNLFHYTIVLDNVYEIHGY